MKGISTLDEFRLQFGLKYANAFLETFLIQKDLSICLYIYIYI